MFKRMKNWVTIRIRVLQFMKEYDKFFKEHNRISDIYLAAGWEHDTRWSPEQKYEIKKAMKRGSWIRNELKELPNKLMHRNSDIRTIELAIWRARLWRDDFKDTLAVTAWATV